ncbi:MAG TPA: hypothetical protein PLV83_06240 [Bacilli bacterium]|nr:hypothetical protein [Bacilli bacterium]
MREVIVLPIEGENSDKFFRGIVYNEERHVDILNQYIEKNNIYKKDDANSIYNQGVKMAFNNYCVLVLDGIDILAFLPNEMTKGQMDWFLNYKKAILQMNMCIVSIKKNKNNDYEVKHIEDSENRFNVLNKFYKKIKKDYKRCDLEDEKRRSI